MAKLREFLRDLSINQAKLSDFVRDPNRVMDSAKLDEQSRLALVSGSATAMWDLLLGREPKPLGPILEPPTEAEAKRGSLVVVGTGIRTVGQLTFEAIAHIKESSIVFYLVADPIAEDAIRQLNPRGAQSLMSHYGEGVQRKDSYEAMVRQILESVRGGMKTCAVYYGHPGVFAFPSHESIRRARREGYIARMLPAVSAEDCLFADLGVDPAVTGCQSFESTDFLLYDRSVDVSSQLVLWQVGVLGDMTYRRAGYNLAPMFPILRARLCSLFGAEHSCIAYEAAIFPGTAPKIQRFTLRELSPGHVNANSTLYIPPCRKNAFNQQVAAAMGLVG